MPKFYVPNPNIKNGILKIDGSEARHIKKTFRLRPGDWIVVFDGSGKDYEGVILEEKGSSVLINVKNIYTSNKEPTIEIILAQSLLKGEKMDYLIQKAVELGVKEIIPFISSRSIPIYDEVKSNRRQTRWTKISIEASKQCGRGFVPEIKSIKTYSEMLNSSSPEFLNLILWEKEGFKLREILERKNEKIFFIVGPEGGFSNEEVEEAKAKGFIPINLGKRILRSETASICVISILQYEWGDIG
jgi:16S rRNA (uracil1498-N3)-methyltransferase